MLDNVTGPGLGWQIIKTDHLKPDPPMHQN